MAKLIVASLLSILIMGCTEVNYPSQPTDTATPIATTKVNDRVEFRVIGNGVPGIVNIRHTDPINGVNLYSGGVPYFAAVSSGEQSIFLFIEANGFGNIFNASLQVQIFVNGRLFREGFATGTTLNAQASGTWRR